MNKASIINLIDCTINYFNYIKENQCKGFDCTDKSLDIISKWGKWEKFNLSKPKIQPKLQQKLQQKVQPKLQPELKSDTLQKIKKDVENCRQCNFALQRKNIVFGSGNPKAKLVFIGEAPGSQETEEGVPFVGEVGDLLTKMIEAMTLTRDQVFISNVIKCHVPDNTHKIKDSQKKVAFYKCHEFVKRQLKVINPDIICCFGTFATQSLLNSKKPITSLRGKFYDYMGIKLMPTYHPAYILQQPKKKREVWEDIKKIMKEMGIRN